MSLSRQNSLHIREPNAQDRLVSLNESQTSSQQPSSGAAGGSGASTQYGVTTMNSDTPQCRPKRPTLPGFSPFMPRSDSCLSSHVSSPDLYTSASTGTDTYLGTDRDSTEGHQSTHVMVETHDIGSGGDDDCDSKRSTRSKQSSSALRRMQTASQRRSWHFDDRTDASDANDFADVTINARFPTSQRQQKKPPVPPRRDKQGSLSGIPVPPDGAGSKNLLELNDASSTGFVTINSESGLSRHDVAQDQTKKRNTNPFLDDCTAKSSPGVPPPPPPPPPSVAQTSLKPAGDVRHVGDHSNESWDNQPWPDPPPPPPLPESPTAGDVEGEQNSAASKFNNVPESLQYLPNSSLSRRTEKNHDSQRGNYQIQEQRSTKMEVPLPGNTTAAGQHDNTRRIATPSSKQFSENRQSSIKAKGKAPPVPFQREYDNPLFNNQSMDERCAQAYEDGFTPPMGRHTAATSFINPPVHPSTLASNPPPYHSVVNTLESEPSPYRRHSAHYGYSHPSEQARSSSPPKYARPRQTNGDFSDHQNHQSRGGNINSTTNKSRPRQVKREHQQRRNNSNPSENHNPQQQRDPYYGSSPDLMARSPRVTRKRLDATGGGDGNSPRRSRTSHQREDRRPCGQVEPKKYAVGHFQPHWADSDL